MNTTNPTVYLHGIGHVPALAPEMHPVGLAAAEALPTGTWGVVAWPAGNPVPTLVESDRPSVIHAQRLAADIARAWDTDRVYLVRRCPVAVTVHSRVYPDAGHLLGSLPVAADGYDKYRDAWHHILHSSTGDPQRDSAHVRNIEAAWRLAHGIAESAPPVDVVNAVAGGPLPAGVYLTAYIAVLAGNLHADAQNRPAATHRPDYQVVERVHELREIVRIRFGTHV